MQAFWRTGYSGTSLSDLEEATGVNRRQLYRVGASKRGLFIDALDSFAFRAGELHLAHLEAPGAGRARIVSTLTMLARPTSNAWGRLGCLLCLTSVDQDAMDDTEIASRVRGYFARIESAYALALERAFERGELVSDAAEQRATARGLFGAHVTLVVLARAGVKEAILVDIAEQAVLTIGQAPAGGNSAS
jgi:AcrR family transcriptional regulator